MIDFDQTTHTYRLRGQVLPSVTQILAPLVDFSGVPEAVLERKRQLGTALHAAIELSVSDDLDVSSIDPAVAPYYAAYEQFLFDSCAHIFAVEQRVWSEIFGYAGTLDLGAIINGKRAVIDVKTTAALSPSVGPQTAAYLAAANESHDIVFTDRYALWLKPDGTYKLHHCKDRTDFAVFQSLLNLYKFKEKHYGSSTLQPA